MKFNEKLISLRKKEGLSQEELGYKLNVTRQTVSKWELGQTTPEMDKLSEMSRIFNVSVDQLINDSEPEMDSNINPINNKIEDQPIQEKGGQNNKIIFIAIIAILVIIGLAFAKGMVEFKNAANNVVDTAGEIINGSMNGIQSNNVGEVAGDFIGGFLNAITENSNTISNILDNATEIDNTTNNNTQNNLGNQDMLNNMQEGMNVISGIMGGNLSEQIEQTQNKVSVQAFNGKIELYAGTSNPLFAVTMLDNIITSNKTNDKKVEVEYSGTKTTDETKIKSIKQKINTLKINQNLEITCDYDTEGYICKVTIEKI